MLRVALRPYADMPAARILYQPLPRPSEYPLPNHPHPGSLPHSPSSDGLSSRCIPPTLKPTPGTPQAIDSMMVLGRLSSRERQHKYIHGIIDIHNLLRRSHSQGSKKATKALSPQNGLPKWLWRMLDHIRIFLHQAVYCLNKVLHSFSFIRYTAKQIG